MSKRMPVVFVSHGAPDALIKAPDAVECWRDIGRHIPEPSAILVVSAHWQAHYATTSRSDAPDTIYDFSGFSPELYRMSYPAPGAPALAEKVTARLSAAGIRAETHLNWGLDHGAWVPLSAMYPKADIPVTQLSLVEDGGPAAHFAIGTALAALRDEGVLIVASGAITHNFSWLNWHATPDQPPSSPAYEFSEWVANRLAARDLPALLNYRSAPNGEAAHPTEEHFMPLFVALGAAMDDTPIRHRPNFSYGALAMDAYVWQDQ
jgi:4,5-DOPA dioxygenase extradiol